MCLLGSCIQSSNEKEATIETDSNKTYIKLKGKRIGHPTSPSAIKTFNDSVLIPIPEFKDGIILGKEIPVPQGNFEFRGNIIINKDYVNINLLIDDTSDKVLRPYSWNGKYEIK